MDPFPRDPQGGTPRVPYTSSSQQPKHGTQYPNISNSPQHNYVSQLRVTMDRPPSRPSSRPASGTDQDGQLINGTNSASSSTGTPAGGTPTTDMPPPRFASPPSSGGADHHNFSIDDDFPTQFSLTPTGPSPDEKRLSDRQVSAHDARYSNRYTPPADSRYTQQPRQLNYDDGHQRTHDDPYRRTSDHHEPYRRTSDHHDPYRRTSDERHHQRGYDERTQRTYEDRHPVDARYMHPGDYPVHRWSGVNGPDHMTHFTSQNIYVDPRPGVGPRFDPQSSPRPMPQYHNYPPQQQPHLTLSQSVPNLDEQFIYNPHQQRDPYYQSPLKHAKSSQNISPESYGALIPAEVRPPEVVTSRQVILPTPHSPPRQARPPRPHSESYDSRGNKDAILDATQSMIVFPSPTTSTQGDSRLRHVTEAWVHKPGSNVAAADEKQFLSLQPPKPEQEDDEYTQGKTVY